jgi:YbbR domain-containing protein
MVYHPFRHLGLKFLSVAVALGLWFIVAGDPTVERSLHVPLERTGWPDNLELVESPPDSVDVRVRGASGLLGTLSAGSVIAMVDLSQAKEGKNYVYLTPSQVRAPFGVEVVEVVPATVPLRFEKSMTKTVPVVPAVEGEPAPGYTRGAVSVEPAMVEVTGPESALRRLKEAATEPVSISGRRSQIRQVVTIGMPDSSVRLTAPVNATITISIEPTPVDRLVKSVPVGVRNVGRGLSAQVVPAAIDVETRGPKDVVERLRRDAISAFVDVAGKGPGRYNFPVRVEPAQDFVVIGTEPAVVQVRIK